MEENTLQNTKINLTSGIKHLKEKQNKKNIISKQLVDCGGVYNEIKNLLCVCVLGGGIFCILF